MEVIMRICEIPQIEKPLKEEKPSENPRDKTAVSASKIAQALLMDAAEKDAEFELSWDKSF